jgi:hypothetical protein
MLSMKRSVSFFILVLIVCGLFYFNKTRTQQENQALVQGVVRLKDDCDSKLIKVLDQKKDYNAKVEDLKAAIDKNNESILQNEGKIKTLSKNPNNRRSIEKLKRQNEELKAENEAKNAETELLNVKIDLYSNVETTFNDWRQKAFDVLEKTHTGNISKENKVKLNSITEDFKNLEKLFNDTFAEPAANTEAEEVKAAEENKSTDESKM